MATIYMQAPNGSVFETTNPDWHQDCKRLSAADGKAARKEYARSELRKLLPPGSTVYTILRHCSASGMSRRISLACIENGRVRTLDHLAASLMDDKVSDKGGIVVSGCGMDMGFHIVSTLGVYMWPGGTPEAHGTRNGEPDKSGTYALKHEWL